MAGKLRYFVRKVIGPTAGISAFFALVASFICVIVAIAPVAPKSDAAAQTDLRTAWMLIQADTMKNGGVYGNWTQIRDVIESSNDNANWSDMHARWGVGPTAIHNDSDGWTILVDVHSNPHKLVLFDHAAASNRDWELVATPDGNPKIFNATAPGTPIRHWKPGDTWAPLRVDGIVVGIWFGLLGLLSAALLAAVNVDESLRRRRRGRMSSENLVDRIVALVAGYLEQRRAARRQAANEAEALDRWYALVGRNRQYGPAKPEAGHEILIADKRETGGALSFVLDVYRWNPSLRDWQKVTGEVSTPAAPEKIKSEWTESDDLAAMSEAWFDFCAWVDQLNRARWIAVAGENEQVSQSALPAGSLSALLPSLPKMIDGAPEGAEALARVTRVQAQAQARPSAK